MVFRPKRVISARPNGTGARLWPGHRGRPGAPPVGALLPGRAPGSPVAGWHGAGSVYLLGGRLGARRPDRGRVHRGGGDDVHGVVAADGDRCGRAGDTRRLTGQRGAPTGPSYGLSRDVTGALRGMGAREACSCAPLRSCPSLRRTIRYALARLRLLCPAPTCGVSARPGDPVLRPRHGGQRGRPRSRHRPNGPAP